MKWALLCAVLIGMAAVTPTWPAAATLYQRGEIVSVEQKSRTRVLYYLVNTPVTQDDPYFEVSVKIKGTIYVGEYTPRHGGDTLPDAWTAGSEVQVRLEKRHFFVKGPGDSDIDFSVVKHMRAESS